MINAASALTPTAPGQPAKGASPVGGEMFALSMLSAATPGAAVVSDGMPAVATDPLRQTLAVPGSVLPSVPDVDPALAWLPAVNIPVPAPLDIPPALRPDAPLAIVRPALAAAPDASPLTTAAPARRGGDTVGEADPAQTSAAAVAEPSEATTPATLSLRRAPASSVADAPALRALPAIVPTVVPTLPPAGPRLPLAPAAPTVVAPQPRPGAEAIVTRPAADPNDTAQPATSEAMPVSGDPRPAQPAAAQPDDAAAPVSARASRSAPRSGPSVAKAPAEPPAPDRTVATPTAVEPAEVRPDPSSPRRAEDAAPTVTDRSPEETAAVPLPVAIVTDTPAAASRDIQTKASSTGRHERTTAAQPTSAEAVPAAVIDGETAATVSADDDTDRDPTALPIAEPVATPRLDPASVAPPVSPPVPVPPATTSDVPVQTLPTAIASDARPRGRRALATPAVPLDTAPPAPDGTIDPQAGPRPAQDRRATNDAGIAPQAQAQVSARAPMAEATGSPAPREPAAPPAIVPAAPGPRTNAPAPTAVAAAPVPSTPVIGAAAPVPVAGALPTAEPRRQSFAREVPGTSRQTVALRPLAPPPLQPTAGTTASAALVFGAAMHAAKTGDDPQRTAPAEPPAVALAAPAALAPVAATSESAAPMLDMRQGNWPTTMIDHIEQLRDAANANDTRIRLVPDALGGIDIAVRTVGNALHVRFTADDASTRALIEEARPELAAIAQERGLRIGQSVVELSQANASQQQTGQNAGQSGGQQSSGASPSNTPQPQNGTAGGQQQTASQAQTGQQQPRQQHTQQPRQPDRPARAPTHEPDAGSSGRVA